MQEWHDSRRENKETAEAQSIFVESWCGHPQICPETNCHRWLGLWQGVGYGGVTDVVSEAQLLMTRTTTKKKCSVLFKLFLWYWHGQTHAVLRWQRFAHDAQVLRQKDLSWHMSLSSWTAELHEWHWNAPLVAVIELPAIDWSGSPSLLMTTSYSSAPWLVRHWLWVSELFAVAAAWQNTSMQFLGGLLVRDGTVTHSWNYWMASL